MINSFINLINSIFNTIKTLVRDYDIWNIKTYLNMDSR